MGPFVSACSEVRASQLGYIPLGIEECIGYAIDVCDGECGTGQRCPFRLERLHHRTHHRSIEVNARVHGGAGVPSDSNDLGVSRAKIAEFGGGLVSLPTRATRRVW